MDVVFVMLSLSVSRLSCDELNFPVWVLFDKHYFVSSSHEIAAVAVDSAVDIGDGCSDVLTSLNVVAVVSAAGA